MANAPGVWLYKGRDKYGQPWLVQVLLLKAGKPGLSDLLRSVETETESLLHDHSIAEYGYDSKAYSAEATGVFYWHLPWNGAVERLSHSSINSFPILLTTARSLIERLVTRHQQGRLDPFLSPQLVSLRTGGADLLGVPISIPQGWVAAPMEDATLAPEEKDTNKLQQSGDLWRLGSTLRDLSLEVSYSGTFAQWLNELLSPTIQHRFKNADEALFALQMVTNGLANETTPTLIGDLVPEQTIPELDTAHRTLPNVGYDDPGLSDQKDPTSGKEDEAPTIWLEKDEIARRKREVAAAATQPLGPKGTVVGVRLREHGGTAPEPNIESPNQERPLPTRVFDDHGNRLDQIHPQEPENMGAFGPGGTVAGDIPLYAVDRGRSRAKTPTTPRPSEPSYPDVPLIDDHLPPKKTRSVGGTLFALVVLAVGAGVVVQLLNPQSPTEVDNTTSNDPTRAHSLSIRSATSVDSWNDVLLETVPSNAEVLSEVDGALLGPSPIRMLVPQDVPTVVLITAPDHEPVRLAVPVRGRITVHLTSMNKVAPCMVDVQAPGSELHVVGYPNITSEIPGRGRYKIPGVVVVRSPEGHGAWIVRCGDFGGQRRHRFVSQAPRGEVEIVVKSPKTATILVGPNDIGKVPARTLSKAGMIKVEARLTPRKSTNKPRSVARWIPAFQDTTIELPRPSRTP
ncbi:MAG: hypothetical protein KTR25_15790 [Myxococcales bacterium]|nr:hypothetical protein [Myxococcales bacterium]